MLTRQAVGMALLRRWQSLAVPVPVLGGEQDGEEAGKPLQGSRGGRLAGAESRVHVLGGVWSLGIGSAHPGIHSTGPAKSEGGPHASPRGSLTPARLPATAWEISFPRTTSARGWRSEGHGPSDPALPGPSTEHPCPHSPGARAPVSTCGVVVVPGGTPPWSRPGPHSSIRVPRTHFSGGGTGGGCCSLRRRPWRPGGSLSQGTFM